MRYLLRPFKSNIGTLVFILLLISPFRSFSETNILVLGDSLIQGYGLSQNDGFVPQLSAWMSANERSVHIINGGASGDTSAGGLARVEWYMQDDLDIMIVALGGNDFLRGIDPKDTLSNLDKILAIGNSRGIKMMLVGLNAPNNFGIEYKKKFDQIFPFLAKKYNVRLVANFIRPILEKVQSGNNLKVYFQPDMLHPNAKGVALIVEQIGPELSQLIHN